MNNECEKMKDRIADYFLGILTDVEAEIMQRHLNDCSTCSEYARTLKDEDKLLTALFAEIDMDMKTRQERVLQALNRSGQSGQNETVSIWTQIIKSSITKLAAAAVIIIAIMAVVHWFGGSIEVTQPVYGISDLPRLIRDIRIIHIKGHVYFPNREQEDEEPDKMEFDYWFDIENGCYRLYKPAGIDEVTGKQKYYTTISDGRYIMKDTYHREGSKSWKSVSFVKLSPFQQRLQIRTIQPFSPFMENPNQVAGFAKTGQEQIGNQTIDIWQGEIKAPDQKIPYKKMKIWLSPSNGRIVRLFIWMNTEKDSMQWMPFVDADKIEYDVTPPPDCFSTEPPEGCELANTKETAIERELGNDGRLRFYVCIGFTLNDGSVIVGWHANHKPEESQAHIFENLKPGGPPPNLPAQIVGLKPGPVEEDITCIGYHLAYTQKNGKFYEWSIYIPNRKIPKRDTFQNYKVIPEYNGVESRSFLGYPNLVTEELTIISEEEFDTWVRGAMAELSDDGKAPENATYENVLQLAGKIRSSLDN